MPFIIDFRSVVPLMPVLSSILRMVSLFFLDFFFYFASAASANTPLAAHSSVSFIDLFFFFLFVFLMPFFSACSECRVSFADSPPAVTVATSVDARRVRCETWAVEAGWSVPERWRKGSWQLTYCFLSLSPLHGLDSSAFSAAAWDVGSRREAVDLSFILKTLG